MEDEESNYLTVDEQAFYNHIANFIDNIEVFDPELDAGWYDFVEKKNIAEYHKMYMAPLLNSPLKDLCKYNPKKKEFIINNSIKAREIFIKNLPSEIKNNFWSLGKGNLIKKLKYVNEIINK